MSYHQILYHIVFATKYRKPTITDAHCRELYAYIHGVIRNKKCYLYRINGTPDQLHLLTDLRPALSLADFIKSIKVASSLWMKESGSFPLFENWQEGYGAFTCSIKEKDAIMEYIKAQKEHHRSETFSEEYKRLLVENGVAFEEKYLL